MDKVIVGIDLGGTNLRIGLVNENNEMVESTIMNSGFLARENEPLGSLGDIIELFMNEHVTTEVLAISIGVPSSVALDKETVICTTNIRNQWNEPVFENINIAKTLKKRFEVPVFVNNDTNNILRYDVYRGGIENNKVNVGVYIGTGVGSSVLVGGKSFVGANGVAFDLGHIPYYGGEEICSCGKKGCCECYASGWKLRAITEQYFQDTQIQEVFSKHKKSPIIESYVGAVGNVIAIMTTIFNPNTLVLGGGVIEMKDFPKAQLEACIKTNTGKDVMSFGFEIIYSTSDYRKGVIGAALFAKQILNGRE